MAPGDFNGRNLTWVWFSSSPSFEGIHGLRKTQNIQPLPSISPFPIEGFRSWEAGTCAKREFLFDFHSLLLKNQYYPKCLPITYKKIHKREKVPCPTAYLHLFPGATRAALLPGRGLLCMERKFLFPHLPLPLLIWVQWGLCPLWGEGGPYGSLGPGPPSLHILGEARA